MKTDRQIHQREDGAWMVWCEKHGKRHTKTTVETEGEAVDWWREHTGQRKRSGGAWCPHRVDLPAPNPFA